MKLLTQKDLENAANLKIPGETTLAKALMQILKFRKFNKNYSKIQNNDPLILVDSLLEQLELKYEIPFDDLKNIPATGGFITVSNHPFGEIDSILLLKLIYEKRKDFKVMANSLLQNIEQFKDIILPVNTIQTNRNIRYSFTGIKKEIDNVKKGHCLGIFPSAETSSFYKDSNVILDKEWQSTVLKAVKNAKVPVIPVYIHGTNSRLFHILDKIHPVLRSARLPANLLNKKNRSIKIRIGSQITVKEQSEFNDIAQFGRYLRARTYSLSSGLEASKFFNKLAIRKKVKTESVVEPIPEHILETEYNKIKGDYELFSIKNYSIICAPTYKIPNIINEIGRLREITFREAGEGTNKSIDVDEYDFYYNHLFIWDKDKSGIVGAYRIGKGREIATFYGINGFYINSLFRIKKDFLPVLIESLELGRSFIIKEYQKKPIPLFLLWKGIMIYLLKNAEYRFLIGPVSISNDFSKFSKSLIVEFIRTYFFNEEMARYIIPRKNFIVKPDRVIDRKIFIDNSESDINKIERIILDIEPGYRLPVLLKKYMEINARIIGFNIDPKFNNCLDGLMILDLYNTPPDLIRGLSREMNDSSILKRFKI
jgi:putative hemolysin